MALAPVPKDAGSANPSDLWRLSATIEGFDDLSFKVSAVC